MLEIHCATCGRRSVVGLRRFTHVVNSPVGLLVGHVCPWGHPGVTITGRAASGVPSRGPAAIDRARAIVAGAPELDHATRATLVALAETSLAGGHPSVPVAA
jgi:hypothetical protein